MASISDEKMKEIEAEMDRFEQEIAVDKPPVNKLIIGTNTYNQVAAQLQAIRQETSTDGTSPSSDSMLPPLPLRRLICLSQLLLHRHPPPPPTSSTDSPRSEVKDMPPPPPPPRPLFMPPQLRGRAPPPPPPPGGPHMGPPGRHMVPPPRPMMPRPPPIGPPLGMPPRPPHPMGHPGHPGHPPPMAGPMPPVPSPYSVFSGPPQQLHSVSEAPVTIEKPKIVYSAPPVKNTGKTSTSSLEPPGGASASEGENAGGLPAKKVVAGIELNVPATQIESQPSMAQAQEMEITQTSEQPKKEKKEKKKKFIRTAAGKVWEDPSLLGWDQDDFRMFCGDLGNEVTDEVLARAFSRFPSFKKAKVVRDRRSNKTKGYGFVSFKDPNDFVRAMREMNGKYVGNRPIKLRKSTWKDRQIDVVRKKDKEKKRLGLR